MNRPHRRTVLECVGCDTALVRCCRLYRKSSVFESGAALCLPPHSRTLARHPGFMVPMRVKKNRMGLNCHPSSDGHTSGFLINPSIRTFQSRERI